MKKRDMLQRFAMAAIAAAMALSATACGDAAYQAPAYKDNAEGQEYEASAQEARPSPTAGPAATEGPEAATDAPSTAPAEAGAATPSPAPTAEPDPTEEPIPAINDAQRIAALGALVGDMSTLYMEEQNYVDVSTGAYDLEWRYGEDLSWSDMKFNDKKKTIRSEEWGAEWETYVETCGWALVFDAGYYMSQFPILAELYGHDEEALLRHYQTVGVHEGRQANEAFCPAAYMENCSGELKELFRDDVECYVIYYMLHYDDEKGIDASNDGSYPTWLSVELSYTQATEVDKVNWYREEAGSGPAQAHPEMMALACLRARIDATGQYEAHDWCRQHHSDAEALLDLMLIDGWDENTTKRYGTRNPIIECPYMKYHESEGHYEAMVDAAQKYMGTSNFYYAKDWEGGSSMHFDVYTADSPRPAGGGQ